MATTVKMILSAVIANLLIRAATGQTTRTTLLNDILTNYDSSVRPYCGSNNLTNATIDIALRQLIDLDEPIQILKINVWVRLKWYDCQLAWTESNYSNIDHLVVPYKKVWVPDLVLYDSVIGQLDGIEDYRLVLNSDGTVSYNFPTSIECSCQINVRYFPFDTQSCVLEFGSWIYNGLELDFFPKASSGDLSSIKGNSEWVFESFAAKRTVSYFGCCPEPFPVVTYTLTLERKSLYYIVNLFIPSVVIALIGVFAFVLPVESGEKIGLEVTVMLALAVFLLVIGDSLPPSSDNFPLLGYYFAFTMVVVGFAAVMTVIVLNLYYRENPNMPKWVKVFFMDKLGRILLVRDSKVEDGGSSDEAQEKTDHKEESFANKLSKPFRVQDSTESLFIKSNKIEAGDEIERPKEQVNQRWTATPDDWKDLSVIIDRLSLVIYIISLIIGTIAIFAPLSNK